MKLINGVVDGFFLQIEIKYIQEDNVREHVDCHPGYIMITPVNSWYMPLQEMYEPRPPLLGSSSVPWCARFSADEPSRGPSVIIDDSGCRGDDSDEGGAMARYAGETGC